MCSLPAVTAGGLWRTKSKECPRPCERTLGRAFRLAGGAVNDSMSSLVFKGNDQSVRDKSHVYSR